MNTAQIINKLNAYKEPRRKAKEDITERIIHNQELKDTQQELTEELKEQNTIDEILNKLLGL